MSDLISIFAARGDLAHLALLAWALMASGLAWFAVRESAAERRRFDDFVRELIRLSAVLRRAGRSRKGGAP